MDKHTRFLSVLVIIATLIAFSNAANASEAASKSRGVQPYGVGLSPAVYFVNFLLLYIANPTEAAKMPAYRAPIPVELNECLQKNPQGCSYDEFARFFDDKVSDRAGGFWPIACAESPKWEALAPSLAKDPEQINEPLGGDRAERLARLLGIRKSMILTDGEYQCTIGDPSTRTTNQDTIFSCINNLTNSNGNTDIPLASYGLAMTEQGDVQSLCAPEAPCLVFNQLFDGPLENIAYNCGWLGKLTRMVIETPFFKFVEHGSNCQQFGGSLTGGACVVESVRLPARRIIE
jgi:hypothetical protein